MKWEEVCKLHPNQYVKLNILDFCIADEKIVMYVTLILVIDNPNMVAKEFLRAKGNTIVYHTGTESRD
ncbi:hypothetical protein [Sporosarcina sp. SAFN-015]|uniref:hypothetical protein n=1 Tax=Sporosarcina sp. SAFN-015 TaxID=3387274 RepID=UPI003F7DFDCC